MPKTTDIEGTFRIPEEAWGRFWNTMLSIPGAAITPTTRAQAPTAKRSNGKTAGGTTSNCLILAALAAGVKLRPALEAVLVQAGKNASSVGSSLQDLKTKHFVKLTAKGWAITASGKKWRKANCKEK